jgi:hypothetical protein
MSAASPRALDRIAALGLFVGAAFGLAGTLVRSPHVQASLWAIDSVGLVIATSLGASGSVPLVATLLGWAWLLMREQTSGGI